MSTDSKMKAVWRNEYGSADVLSVRDDAPKPEITDDTMIVEVKATTFTEGDRHLLTGTPMLIRLFGYGMTHPKHHIMGQYASGIVTELGTNVKDFKIGEEVFGACEDHMACWGQYVRVNPSKFVTKPNNISHDEAVGLLFGGLTAYEGIYNTAKVKAQERVLVIGGSGEVGIYLVQMCKALDAHVTASCRKGKMQAVKDLGADEVIDYKTTDFADLDHFDVIFDTSGRSSNGHLRSGLKPHGRVVMVSAGDSYWTGGMGRVMRGSMVSAFTSKKLLMLMTVPTEENVSAVRKMAENGDIKCIIHKTFPLNQAKDAVEYFSARKSESGSNDLGVIILQPFE